MHQAKSGAIGTSHIPLRIAFVKAALHLIVAGASTLRAKKVITSTMSENNITYHLEHEMDGAQRDGIARALRFGVRVDTKAVDDNPEVRGEIDIKFWSSGFPYRHDYYLAVEAKKLRGSGDSLADKYVTGGVADFVSAKYSRGHDYGIMLGYVVVPPLTIALAKVMQAMASRRAETREEQGLYPDASLIDHPHTHLSEHLQQGNDAPIRLVHLFLDFTS